MIELKSISKKYTSEIFKDFSYIFDENNIYYLSGQNGSGKTTLLKLIKGIYLCDQGEIKLDPKLTQKDDIAYIDGNFRTFFHRLTVRQNLEYFFSLQNTNNDNKSISELLDFFSVTKLEHKTFSSLSQGQMQIVSIIRGFLLDPKIILLDEVFSSLDIANKNIIYAYLSKFILKDKNLVIFTSHEKKHDDLNFNELCLN